MTKDNAPEEVSFEQGLKRLEEIVQSMEEGDLSLEASMAAFEEGMKLVKDCQGKLNEVEKKIEVLGQSDEA